MNAQKLLRILGITATVMSIGSDLISDFVDDKKIEKLVSKKVKEELRKQMNNY